MTLPPVAFQGVPGAYSDLACRTALPGHPTVPCASFEAAIEAVRSGRAGLGMLACENSLVGRVPDIHALLPTSGLRIVGEHFQRVEHCLLAIPGATIDGLKRLHTHPVAMGQVRRLIAELGLTPVIEADTALAAEQIAARGDPADAAIASALAAELYGLDILRRNVEDEAHNTTRFYICARPDADGVAAPIGAAGGTMMTTLVFRTRNLPASLYKALGGFATNGLNLTRLESYMLDGAFTATQFLCDVEGHPDSAPMANALDELRYFAADLDILGVYPASSFRSF
ncbi:prephenate dehydratase [Endobacter medicaginis]|uniref:prephenate dehydratase n=1 Tax=Endobacter medicaginis TaxID=1181271 RepID=A0A839UWM3_9PROT|nr:prephenate dehydratase [Endobacter medicaginis]MBB3172773.1 prephenate dehydratase [Endobacter medicaginis]MCX5474380.1 prephenate dehydratase [Endobacter medicaginis]NVN30628.1 prephenate dehydratase [Endobacter medicaginis]